MWSICAQGTSEQQCIWERNPLNYQSIRWVRASGGHQQGIKGVGAARTPGTYEQPQGQSLLFVKQLHKLKPALSEVLDQILGSCGCAQAWQSTDSRNQCGIPAVEVVEGQSSTIAHLWESTGRQKFLPSVPSEDMDHRQERIKYFSAISQPFQTREVVLFDLPTKAPYLRMNGSLP